MDEDGNETGAKSGGQKRATDDTIPWYERSQPSPATIAALEFQVASLLDDQRSALNWNGREIVVNEPGGLKRKLATLRRIAKDKFPKRGDVEDVLSDTIHEYGLWKYANPLGFWTALRRNMADAIKTAFESKRVHAESTEDTQNEPAKSLEGIEDDEAERNWLAEHYGQLHAAGPSLAEKWDLARASDDELDRLVLESATDLMADDDYLEELSHDSRQQAKLTRLAAAIRARTGCSQAQAYRQLERFRERYSGRNNKNPTGAQNP